MWLSLPRAQELAGRSFWKTSRKQIGSHSSLDEGVEERRGSRERKRLWGQVTWVVPRARNR